MKEKKHLKQRIQDAEEGNIYTNAELAELISLRIKLNGVISSIKMQFPKTDIETVFINLLTVEVAKNFQLDPENPVAYGIKAITFCITEVEKFKTQCLIQQQKISQTPSPAITRQYTPNEINQIEAKIQSLTENWNYELKKYKTNGLTIFLNLDPTFLGSNPLF